MDKNDLVLDQCGNVTLSMRKVVRRRTASFSTTGPSSFRPITSNCLRGGTERIRKLNKNLWPTNYQMMPRATTTEMWMKHLKWTSGAYFSSWEMLSWVMVSPSSESMMFFLPFRRFVVDCCKLARAQPSYTFGVERESFLCLGKFDEERREESKSGDLEKIPSNRNPTRNKTC